MKIEITELHKIELKPNEVLIIKTPGKPGHEAHRHLKQLFGKQYLVVTPEVEFSKVSKEK